MTAPEAQADRATAREPGDDGVRGRSPREETDTGLGGSATRVSIKVGIDAEELAGQRYPYQEDIGLLDDVDLDASTPGQDLNWLEDVTLLIEDGMPAVFDRYSNSFLKIYFDIPAGRGDELARKVLIKHLQEGNSYGIRLKEVHCKFPQPELGPWTVGSRTVGAQWSPPQLEGWQRPAGH